MDKKDLISQLINVKNNYLLTLAALSLFSNENSYPILDKSDCKFAHYTFEFKQVSKMMKQSKDKDIVCKEFLNMGLRALIKESFELIKSYCEETKRDHIFKKQTWYHFSRIIRNCLSHNFQFEFSNYDKNLLPIIWRGKTINLDMNKTFLNLSFFGYVEAWELFNEMNNFIEMVI